jgi:hypothetical protein
LSAEPVVDREIAPLGDERSALVCEALAASIDLPGTSLQIREFHETSLVQIGETPPLCLRGLELAPEPGELSVEQLVVGCRSVCGEGALAGKEDVGSQQCSSHLVEDEGVEFVGSDIALRASAVLTASPDGIVIVAPVVAVDGPVATPHLMTADADGAVPTLQQAAQ